MEKNSLDTVRMHLHLVETLGAHFVVHTLALTHLQQHVERRSAQKGHFGKPISPVTLRKEVASLRGCWNWGAQGELLAGRFPNRGLKYPKTAKKPPFQTWEEIKRQSQAAIRRRAGEVWPGVRRRLPDGIVQRHDRVLEGGEGRRGLPDRGWLEEDQPDPRGGPGEGVRRQHQR